MNQTAQPQEIILPFGAVGEPLETLLIALENKLDRQWPPQFAGIRGAREVFLLTVKLSRNTWDTILWIIAEKPEDPARLPRYTISVPPLTRTILDSVFTTVFLLEDLPARCEWFDKSGWREVRQELDRYRTEYGTLAEWSLFINELSRVVDSMARDIGLTPAEVGDPSQIPHWPNPGRMPGYGLKQGAPVPPTRQFLTYLNDWFYRDLSAQSHLTFPGLASRGPCLLRHLEAQEDLERRLRKFKSDQASTAITLLLALVSEIEAYFSFGLSSRVRYLWGIITPGWGPAKEVYDRRYAALLPN